MGAFSRGQNVLTHIGAVHLPPDGTGCGNGLFCCKVRKAGEVGGGIAERRLAEGQEALDISLLNISLLGIEVDSIVEKVGNEEAVLFP
jgi:hypothetical protein